MLTEAEKKWLYSRENVEMVTGTYLCQFCQYMDDNLGECIFHRCPKFVPNYRDAAEFEARVAVKLTHSHDELTSCDGFDATCHSETLTCWECRLKHARLVVEEEMEK